MSSVCQERHTSAAPSFPKGAAKSENHDSTIPALLEALSSTPYACSGIRRLSGGTVNSTYRGVLAHSLPGGALTAVVKLSGVFVNPIAGVLLPASRSSTEYAVLEALSEGLSPELKHDRFTIVTPRPYWLFAEQNVRVIEDIPGTMELLTLLSSSLVPSMSSDFASSLGEALGLWLRSFHSRASRHGCSKLLEKIDENAVCRDAMYTMYRGRLENNIEKFPHVFEGVVDKVRAYVREEIEWSDERIGLVHGDFAARNILISQKALNEAEEVVLAPIDWEIAHYGRQDVDLAHIIGDLYMLQELHGIDTDGAILRGLVKGYGLWDEGAIFHTAIYVGIQILTWTFATAHGCSIEQEQKFVALARDLIIKGHERDRTWLTTTQLGCLLFSQ